MMTALLVVLLSQSTQVRVTNTGLAAPVSVRCANAAGTAFESCAGAGASGLTDTQLRASPVLVDIYSDGGAGVSGLTNAQLRASPINVLVDGGSINVVQTTSPWVVSGSVTTGGLTDTQLRASQLYVNALIDGGSINVVQTTSPWVVSGAVTTSGTATVSGTVTSNQGLGEDGGRQWNASADINRVGGAVIGTVLPIGFDGGPVTIVGTLPALTAGSAIIGSVRIDQTTPGTTNAVQANAGTNLNTSALALDATLTNRTQKAVVTDGTRDATVKAASTAAVAADTALVVAISPNNTVPTSLATLPALTAGAAVIGALTANQSVNAAQINGITPLMGTGATGTGSLRVTLATNSPGFSTSGGTIAADSQLEASRAVAYGSSPAAIAATTQAPAISDLEGRRYVNTGHPRAVSCQFAAASTATLLELTGCAAVASNSYYITSWSTCGGTATAATVPALLRSGTGVNCATGTVTWDTCFHAAAGCCQFIFPTPIKVTQAHAICGIDATVGTKSFTVNGYIAP